MPNKKIPKCEKGTPCGKVCIPRDNRCISEMDTFKSDLLNTFKDFLGKNLNETLLKEKIADLSDKIKNKKYKNFNNFLVDNFSLAEQHKLLSGSGNKKSRDSSIILLAQLFAENNKQPTKRNEDELNNYYNNLKDTIDEISSLTGEDSEIIINDLVNLSGLSKDGKKLFSDEMKTHILDTSDNISLSRKGIRLVSDNSVKVLEETLLLNNNNEYNLNPKTYVNIRIALRAVLNNRDIITKSQLKSINNLLIDKYNDKDIATIIRLFESADASNNDNKYNGGLALLGFSLLNKIATIESLDIESIKNIQNLSFFKKVYTNVRNNGQRQKLYLKNVGGDENKLFNSDKPFGETNLLDANGQIVKKANGNVKRNILPEKVLISPKLNNLLGGNKLIQGDSAAIPKYADGSIETENIKIERARLKSVFESGFESFNDKSTSKNKIIQAFKKSFKKPFNGLLIDGETGFLNILDNLSSKLPSSAKDVNKFKAAILKAKADGNYNELNTLFKGDYLDLLTGLGYTTIEASEYLAIAYESFANNKSTAYLDKYAGRAFPFADAAILEEGPIDAIKLISVKYGGTGVPADTPALVNLTNPELNGIHGGPATNQDLYKSENSILEFIDNGVKLKSGISNEDINNRLNELKEHFDYEKLRNLAGSRNTTARETLAKIDELLLKLKNGQTVNFNDLGLNTDKVKRRYHNSAHEGLEDIAAILNSDVYEEKIKEALLKKINSERDTNSAIKSLEELSKKELLERHGVVADKLANGKYQINKYYENHNLQISLAHIMVMILAKETFNSFFKSSSDNFYFLPAENHPDGTKVNGGLEKTVSKEDLMNLILDLKFSDRTDAGPGRGSSSGIQYLFDFLSLS